MQPSSSVLSVVDLDDTLFRSPARGGHGHPVSVTRDGQPQGYMSPAQRQLFEMLRRAGRVVPTTARTPAQLARVRLPFDDFAICTNGAVILDPSGAPDPAWRALVERHRDALTTDADGLAALAADSPGGGALKIRTVDAWDRPWMVAVRHPTRDAVPLQRWADTLRPRLPDGWAFDVAGDRALLYPAAIDKGAAVDWLLENHVSQPTLILGAGDRHGDAAFMARGHFALVPTRSVLFERLVRGT